MSERETTFFISPPWGGKTTLGKIISAMTENDKHFPVMDMSTEIENHRKLGTEFGKKFDELVELKINGGLLPDDLIAGALVSSLENWKVPIFHSFVSGVPRTLNQTVQFLARFPDVRLIHIRASLIEVMCNQSFAKREMRPDDSPEKVRERYDKYMDQTVPGIEHFKRLRPKKVLELQFTDPMAYKMDEIIKFIPVRGKTKSRWSHNCSNRLHEARKWIQARDQERPEFLRRLAEMIGKSKQESQKPPKPIPPRKGPDYKNPAFHLASLTEQVPPPQLVNQ